MLNLHLLRMSAELGWLRRENEGRKARMPEKPYVSKKEEAAEQYGISPEQAEYLLERGMETKLNGKPITGKRQNRSVEIK